MFEKKNLTTINTRIRSAFVVRFRPRTFFELGRKQLMLHQHFGNTNAPIKILFTAYFISYNSDSINCIECYL